MANIKIIGLGGVGTALCDNLCRFLNYHEDDFSITLIDGDAYEVKNKIRQSFRKLGNKAKIKAEEIRFMYDKLDVDEVEQFITPENISSILREDDIIFVCVDNHVSRKLVSDHCGTLNHCILISGGNEFEDGNVQLYRRKGGKDITASLTDYHPEIGNPVDKSPDDMSCEELSKSAPQLLFTNLSVATIMCWVFYNTYEKQDDKIGEIYFDMRTMSAASSQRAPLN